VGGTDANWFSKVGRAQAMKRTKKKRETKRRPATSTEKASGQKRRFDQLLDDAIFGVKKKNQRG